MDKKLVSVSIRIPSDLHESAKSRAKGEDRSLNSWMLQAIRVALAKRSK